MAKKLRKIKSFLSILPIYFLTAMILLSGLVYFSQGSPIAGLPSPTRNSIAASNQPSASPVANKNTAATQGTSPTPKDVNQKLGIYIIDIGQGDSIFLKSPSGRTMLIDSGESSAYKALNSFLKAQEIDRIDMLVVTHPHSDHVGAMSKIVENYDVRSIYMPNVTHNGSNYSDFLEAVQNKGLKINRLAGSKDKTLSWSSECIMNVLAPLGTGYDQINDYSLVLKINYKNFSMLLTGDAESTSEKEMLEKLPASLLKSTLLKVGHHGSRSSTTEKFLKAVSPKEAFISVGADNDSGHPHQEVLNRLANAGVKIYRTDLNGTVEILSDGTGYTVNPAK